MKKNTKKFSLSCIRESFTEYFVANNHRELPSSPLVPVNDNSLLFTNSGMVQFKDYFLSKARPPFESAVTVQNCLRAGGKHNDLENVGYTARHHTFFEMLGNFSFGAYFKEESILYAWQLLTEVFDIEPEKLLVTVYFEDTESYDIWRKKINLEAHRVIRIGDHNGNRHQSDNFWQMADIGPCGPCTEIFFDHGPSVKGGLPGSSDGEGDRFVEIWNLVFMEYQKLASGELGKLPIPCVDTGMGLERISAVLQNVTSNYEIDVFKRLTRKISSFIDLDQSHETSLRVIADHIRASCFLISENIVPSNEGRGYVLRRILRRASRHAYKLGKRDPFLHKFVSDVVSDFQQPDQFVENLNLISETILMEEEKFSETLVKGLRILQEELEKSKTKVLDGNIAFLLYDTYGFPVELTADICRENEVTFNLEKFDEEMAKQKTRAKVASKFVLNEEVGITNHSSVFTGYNDQKVSSEILALFSKGKEVRRAKEGDQVSIIFDRTCFYAESGGQVGDTGIFNSSEATFEVLSTNKVGRAFVHHGILRQGKISLKQQMYGEFDLKNREMIKRNHSATHLLHFSLRQVLGSTVTQKGSQVDAKKTRFDFAYSKPLTGMQIEEIERIVNNEILSNEKTVMSEMPYDEAIESGAIGLFGERYESNVRVMQIGSSRELCGGTHVERTGDIGSFKVLSESGVASGVRRIEAITANAVVSHFRTIENILSRSCALLGATPINLVERIETTLTSLDKNEKTLAQMNMKSIKRQIKELIEKAKKNCEDEPFKIIADEIKHVSVKELREASDEITSGCSSSFTVLGCVFKEKVHVVVRVTSDLMDKLSADFIAKEMAIMIGGKGGGKSSFAQAGGSIPSKLEPALIKIKKFIFYKIRSVNEN